MLLNEEKLTIKWFNKVPADALKIRNEVFVVEQGFSEQEEFDGMDDKALHIVIDQGEKPVATGRLFLSEADGSCHIGRIAVIKS